MAEVAAQPSARVKAPRAPDVDELRDESRKKPSSTRCEARGIHKAFGDNPILRGVDLEIPEGAFAVLVGPSGCGKSTLLRIVAGLETVDAGSVRLAGRDVTELPPRDRDVAMVFQSYALYPHLTVRENLAFGLRLRGADSHEIDQRIREASAMLSLDALLDRLPKQLSGGQRQRVAMGRAIVRRPAIFLFDEPLSNLDAALRAEVRVEIRRQHDKLGATTLYVTHDQVEAMTLADTLWVMNRGVVEQRGAPLDVYERPRTRFVAGFLGSPQMNFLEATLKRQEGTWLAEGGGLHVEVEAERFGASLEEGRRVTVGVRPHDLHLKRGEPDPACTLKVEIVEALGFEAFAHGCLTARPGALPPAWSNVREAGPRVALRLEAEEARAVRAGEALPLVAEPARVHLYDSVSGVALDART
jgi:ABC-type sugar transport system ATPase subunit